MYQQFNKLGMGEKRLILAVINTKNLKMVVFIVQHKLGCVFIAKFETFLISLQKN